MGRRAGSLMAVFTRKNKPWTDEEIAVVKELFATTSNEEIGRRIARSRDAVRVMGAKLGLNKPPGSVLARTVIELRKQNAAAHPGTLMYHLALLGCDDDYKPDAPQPTRVSNALPGTPEKIEELRRRVECGEPLWHPEDRLYV